MDVDTLVRHGLPVVMVVRQQRRIWGLEKHPMQRHVRLRRRRRPATRDCRYDEVVRALGGAGRAGDTAADLGPALDRAFASGVPYLVNVVTDPDDAYPRSTTGV